MWRRAKATRACCAADVTRTSVRRVCWTTFPAEVNTRNRSCFGRASDESPGKATRLNALSRL